MEKYQSNSHRSKELAAAESTQEKKIEKVVSGKAKTKQNKVRGLTDIFISEDASNVKSYIFMDVLVPAIKKAISDIVTDGIEMILYGSTGGKRTKSSSKVSYRSYYDDGRRDRDRGSSRDSYAARTRFDYEDIIFPTRGDAELVREQMDEVIDRYGLVTVGDMYEMAGLSNAPYTANKYGWTNIRTAEPIRTRDGYVLKLPKAMPID